MYFHLARKIKQHKFKQDFRDSVPFFDEKG